jgi:predicted NUDIX family NTP pyrophosphohydrolase
MAPRSRTSAGILMFRRRRETIEFFLAHPGGPLFVHKDKGHWTIPKAKPRRAKTY